MPVSNEATHERFSEMTRILFDRSLQDGNETSATPVPAPTGFDGGDIPAPSLPTAPPQPEDDESLQSDFQNAQPLIFLVVALIVLFAIYKTYQTCRHRREQYLMRLRSVQADQVLGDMQMVPSEDPDAELL